MRAHKAFTLIELMVVVVIIALVAAIVYPAYSGHIKRTRRLGCMGELVNLANAVEQYFTVNSTYVGAGTGTTTTYGAPAASVFPSECPLDGTDKYYDMTLITPTSTTYTLRATPKGAQAGNGFFELTSTGTRGWDKDNDSSTAEASWDDR